MSGVEVTGVAVDDDGVTVTTTQGAVRARTAVVAAGAWVEELVGPVAPLPPIRVTEHRVFHFPRRDESVVWPVTLHRDAIDIYHLPGGRDGGPGDARKIAEHTGPVTTGRTREGVVDEASRARIVDYVERWLPGLEPTPFAETTCLYTSTPSEDFLIDRVGPLVVVSACSGHGAKLAPTVGRIAADLGAGPGPGRAPLHLLRPRGHPVRRDEDVMTLDPVAYQPYSDPDDFIREVTDRIWVDRDIDHIYENYEPDSIVHVALGTITTRAEVIEGSTMRMADSAAQPGAMPGQAEDVVWEARGTTGSSARTSSTAGRTAISTASDAGSACTAWPTASTARPDGRGVDRPRRPRPCPADGAGPRRAGPRALLPRLLRVVAASGPRRRAGRGRQRARGPTTTAPSASSCSSSSRRSGTSGTSPL